MKIVIIGAGTSAITVADILIRDRNFTIAGFIGTDEEETSEVLGGKGENVCGGYVPGNK